MAEIQTESKNTSLELKNREILRLTGITDVISFDEMSVYLVTESGNLLIEGNSLHITTLDVANGNMTVEGFIRSLIYNDKETTKKGGFFSKVIK